MRQYTLEQWNQFTPKRQEKIRRSYELAGEKYRKELAEWEERRRIEDMNPVYRMIYLLKKSWMSK